ncbi:MAG: hypothetical protein CL498_03505 [Actinobacteria bacterium]|nr:hypothetical protein [Actinomycetota bacterium]|tara:strand:- start:9680 stop:10036 length:357 start_codon:yes stop_codon:yes gene_type:complete
MRDKTNWKVTRPKSMTHLIADDYYDYLFGKALCGIKFQKGNTIENVLAGTKVNCANCLIRISWAKKINRKKAVSEKGIIGYTETTYMLLKDLKQSNLKSNGKQNYVSGETFITFTDKW